MKVLIMAGGQGTRFWPLSRRSHPKQFLSLRGTESLLQETVSRLQPLVQPADVYIVCSEPYAALVRGQLPDVPAANVIIEPAARNTAPCIGLAALYLRREYPGESMLVLPSDHVIGDVEGFHRVIQAGDRLAHSGYLVTFGITPRSAATGYGYLQVGSELGVFGGLTAFQVVRFTEKPDLKRAREFLADGRYLWNSGMFMWAVQGILDAIEVSMPALAEALREIETVWGDSEKTARIFERLESASIDYGVMEKVNGVAVLPCDLGWCDVGTWVSVKDLLQSSAEEIVTNTEVESVGSRDCLVRSESEKLVALVGVNGLVVVETADALLVCSKEASENIKSVVEKLRARGLDKYL